MLTNFMQVFIQTLTVIVVICVGLGNTGSISNDGHLSPNEPLQLLNKEAERTGNPFEQAWIKSKTIYETRVTLKKYVKALNEAQMRIIIAYTFEDPPFFRDLNKDIRDHFPDLSNQKYPQATRILSMALKKLGEFQRKNGFKLPEVVYRNEDKNIILPVYKALLESGELGVLKQFTSTSRSRNKTVNTDDTPNRIITTFDDPKVGADIDVFSNYDEEEFLLPYNVKYRVKRIENDEATLEGPNYINTGHHLEMSYSFSLFSFLLYILLN